MKKSIFGLSIILMVLMTLMSGCLTISYDSKVNRNGEIVQYDAIVDTNSMVYGMLNSINENENGETLRESITSNGGEYEEEWDGNDVRIIIKSISPDEAYTETDENYIVYKDPIGNTTSDYENGEENPFASSVNIHYYLEMPTNIIDSNADLIDGKKAEWHMVNGSSMKNIYAKCEIPSITMSFDSKVNKNEEIILYDMIIDTNFLYDILNSEISEDESGKTLRENVISEGGEYEEESNGDDVRIIVRGISPEKAYIIKGIPEKAYAEKTDNYLIYKDPIEAMAYDYENEEEGPFGSSIKIHYYLEMPNKIIDSNADFVDENKAEWHMVNENSIKDVYAKCEVPSLPGISFFSSLCMLLIIGLVKKR